MSSGRRTTDQKGFVKFPVDSKEYSNSKEGGMFVRLLVEFSDHYEVVCCGGANYVIHDECLMGDHDHLLPNEPTPDLESLTREQKARDAYCESHYPLLHAKEEDIESGIQRYISKPYLAAMTIGSTGWSGYKKDDGYWICQEADLTEEGAALMALMRKLYPGCRVVLQTWLDT